MSETAHKNDSTSREEGEPTAPSNFIRTIIDGDLEQGAHDRIVTRFPPEPNGYLHIGHAKSICLNFGLALDYPGRCHLRFDDTNPVKEDTEYVESIIEDVQWLGFDWGEHLYFASDYFEQMYQYALDLIRAGKAYVDSLPAEKVSEYRGGPGTPGVPSPYRDRSVEENLELFEGMRRGDFPDGAHILRAKIDMSSPNLIMRDPPLYRIRHATHHRTGDDWCIYPMYDYAHCLEDALEEVTHSICTLEFENNRELYDWVLDHLETPARPHQYEFARLSLGYTIMSKRKLLQLVQEEHVSGWDDPRMPTIAGLRRRGVTPEAIRTFCELIGVAKANSTVDIGLLEHAIRDDLNYKTPRRMCVLEPLRVVLTNYPEGEVEQLEMPSYPEEMDREETRAVPFSRVLYIEREDFAEEPPRKWRRLAPGWEIRLRYAYVIKCEEVVRDDTGAIVELRCTYDPETRGGEIPDGRTIKGGVIHWVSAEGSVPATVRLYDRLFTVEKPDSDPERDFLEFLNPDSLVVKEARVEPSVQQEEEMRYQFERQGYFARDVVDSSKEELVFNRVVALRDSWAKLQKKQEPSEPKPEKVEAAPAEPREPGKPRSWERDQLRAEDPVLASYMERFEGELGLEHDAADILSGDRALAEFFEAALGEHDNPVGVANWIINELLRELKDRELGELPFGPAAVGGLVALLDDETLNSTAAKEVFEVLLAEGGDPAQIVAERGLEQLSSPAKLLPFIEEVLAANPENVERHREGSKNLLGFFIGQVMKATNRRADPTLARELLQRELEG